MLRLRTSLLFPLIVGLTCPPSTAAEPNAIAARRVAERSSAAFAKAANDVSTGSSALQDARQSFAPLMHAEVVARMVLPRAAFKESTTQQRREVAEYISHIWAKTMLGFYRNASPNGKPRAVVAPATLNMWQEKDSSLASRKLEVLCWLAKVDPPCHSVLVEVQFAAGESNDIPLSYTYELVPAQANNLYQITDIVVPEADISLRDNILQQIPREASINEVLTLMARWVAERK